MSKFALQALDMVNNASELQIQEIATIRPGVAMCMGWAGSKSLNKPPVYRHNGVLAVLQHLWLLTDKNRLLWLYYLILNPISTQS
jgi:hypothetical protein